jgi:hypothetical protein
MPEYESVVDDGVVDEDSLVSGLSLEFSRPGSKIAEERYGIKAGDNKSGGEPKTSLKSGLTSQSVIDDVCKFKKNCSLSPSRKSDVRS